MLGPIFSAAVRDMTGFFNAAWIVYIVVFAAMAFSALLVVKSGSKIRQLYPN